MKDGFVKEWVYKSRERMEKREKGHMGSNIGLVW